MLQKFLFRRPTPGLGKALCFLFIPLGTASWSLMEPHGAQRPGLILILRVPGLRGPSGLNGRATRAARLGSSATPPQITDNIRCATFLLLELEEHALLRGRSAGNRAFLTPSSFRPPSGSTLGLWRFPYKWNDCNGIRWSFPSNYLRSQQGVITRINLVQTTNYFEAL